MSSASLCWLCLAKTTPLESQFEIVLWVPWDHSAADILCHWALKEKFQIIQVQVHTCCIHMSAITLYVGMAVILYVCRYSAFGRGCRYYLKGRPLLVLHTMPLYGSAVPRDQNLHKKRLYLHRSWSFYLSHRPILFRHHSWCVFDPCRASCIDWAKGSSKRMC